MTSSSQPLLESLSRFQATAHTANRQITAALTRRRAAGDHALVRQLTVVEDALDLYGAAIQSIWGHEFIPCEQCSQEAILWQKREGVHFFCEACREASRNHDPFRHLTRHDELAEYRRFLTLLRDDGSDDRQRFPESLLGLIRSQYREADVARWTVWSELHRHGGSDRQLSEPLIDLIDPYLQVAQRVLVEYGQERHLRCERRECQAEPTLWCQYSDRDRDDIEFWCEEHADEMLAYPNASSYRWQGMRTFDGRKRERAQQ